MTYQYHDESIIKELPEDTIFVFGSNLAGSHGGGAARTALQHFGAVLGVGRGWSGQSFAIPTLNEHIQQMPLSQIQHYVDDFKIYAENHPKMKYYLTPIGCGIAGYDVADIAPMFKGIADNVIMPESFRPYVEGGSKNRFPTLTGKMVQQFLCDEVIFYYNHGSDSFEDALNKTSLKRNEKDIALLVLNEEMYPHDRYGRGREFEISDVLSKLNGQIFQLDSNSEGAMIFVGVIMALMELYDFDEQQFIQLWQGKISISHPVNRK